MFGVLSEFWTSRATHRVTLRPAASRRAFCRSF